jgi:hypothetical protein
VGENESISHIMFQQYSVLSWLLSVYICSLWLFVLVISSYAKLYVVTFCPVTFCPICFVKMQNCNCDFFSCDFSSVTFCLWLFVLWLSVLHSYYAPAGRYINAWMHSLKKSVKLEIVNRYDLWVLRHKIGGAKVFVNNVQWSDQMM